MKGRAHDINEALRGVTAGRVSTAEQDEAAFPRLSAFDQAGVYVGSFSGQSPWELHQSGDELLHVLEGKVEITLLTEPEPTRVTVAAGNLIVVPKGVWHRQNALPSVTLLALTPDDSEISQAKDPRR